jgi:hypothetical protein
LQKVNELQSIFLKYRPSDSFLYTTPSDSAGILVFAQLEGKTTRYQINLTDHAFWLGRNSFDYCIEFREYGASVSVNKRGINIAKEILLPCYPFVDKDIKFQGMPFDSSGKKVIFSGGSLYKTIDDKGTYYYIVSTILKKNKDTIFLYAGSGDDSYLRNLQSKYLNRIYYIKERTDLYQLMRHITIYLNTYPISGGLMMQYAAVAGKIPLTLKNDHDADGALINQDNLEIEYDNANDLINDTCRLLDDEEYRLKREQLLKDSVISEKYFNDQVLMLIGSHRTDFKFLTPDLNLEKFQTEYRIQFNKNTFTDAVATIMNRSLINEYKSMYVKKFIGSLAKKKSCK